ncbi:MAG TPA: thioredoxin family protein [Novosphingobium sp.]|nr:thioredoxin family protein [Novosphingobium sp.]
MRLPLMPALFAAALMAGTGAVAAGAPAPRLAQSSFAQLPQPLPLPYDEAANAHTDLAKAKARAKAQHKLLLIDMGGNWCGDCRVLAGTMHLPQLAAFIDKHYVVVTVDVGRFSKNLDISAAYGIARPAGVPAILVVDPRSNTLVNAGHVTALADARSMSPQALADWLAQWVR